MTDLCEGFLFICTLKEPFKIKYPIQAEFGFLPPGRILILKEGTHIQFCRTPCWTLRLSPHFVTLRNYLISLCALILHIRWSDNNIYIGFLSKNESCIGCKQDFWNRKLNGEVDLPWHYSHIRSRATILERFVTCFIYSIYQTFSCFYCVQNIFFYESYMTTLGEKTCFSYSAARKFHIN